MNRGILKGLIIGFIAGAIAVAAVPVYGAVKQYILTEANYGIVVNGIAYNDPERPILNYEGSTYVPLAKVGELLGAPVRYNEQLKRVEIGAATPTLEEDTVVEKDISGGQPGAAGATDGPAGRKNDTLRPDTEFVEDKEPGYKGYPDSADPSYQWAVYYGLDMPPLMSEGWISTAMLHEIHSIYFNGSGTPYVMNFEKGGFLNEKILASITLSEEIAKAKYGDFSVDGIRIKKYDGTYFFNIKDLQAKGIID